MWTIISICLLIVELTVGVLFALQYIRKRSVYKTVLFVAVVFVINFALYFVPYLYGQLQGEKSIVAYEIFGVIGKAIKLFAFDVSAGDVTAFSETYPVFIATYSVGVLLAMSATILTAVTAFYSGIVRAIRVHRIFKQKSCDIVLGSLEKSMEYAQSHTNTVLLLTEDTERAEVKTLTESGYAVLRRKVDGKLLSSSLFSQGTTYNFVFSLEDEGEINRVLFVFNEYFLTSLSQKDFQLFLEVAPEKMQTVELQIQKCTALTGKITLFSSVGLIAGDFMEKYPMTAFLPRDFYCEDRSLHTGVHIHAHFLGFGALQREMFRQSVICNQFVHYEKGAYAVYPVQYHIYDQQGDETDMVAVGGIERKFENLKQTEKEYVCLPEKPFVCDVTPILGSSYKALDAVRLATKNARSYHFIYVDCGDGYQNAITAQKLIEELENSDNYRVFVRTEGQNLPAYERVNYYGNRASVFCHDVVVDESHMTVAKEIHRRYERQNLQKKGEREEDAQAKSVSVAAESWKKQDLFTKNSNLFAARSLRFKLNLLGFDYEKGQGEERKELTEICKAFPSAFPKEIVCRRDISCALVAYEHARWNAYHLMFGYLPMKSKDYKVEEKDGRPVAVTKDKKQKRHACLASYKGLLAVSDTFTKLAENQGYKENDFDFYAYDLSSYCTANRILTALGYKVTVKK